MKSCRSNLHRSTLTRHFCELTTTTTTTTTKKRSNSVLLFKTHPIENNYCIIESLLLTLRCLFSAENQYVCAFWPNVNILQVGTFNNVQRAPLVNFRDLLRARRRSILILLRYEHPETLFNHSNRARQDGGGALGCVLAVVTAGKQLIRRSERIVIFAISRNRGPSSLLRLARTFLHKKRCAAA